MSEVPAVYTPDNEPYLGRRLVYEYDRMISATLEHNARIARRTHQGQLTSLQKAACIIVPQGLSIALSIRELIRQTYIFGAYTLVRPLVERTITMLYLYSFQEKLAIWEKGWLHNERPSVSRMIDELIRSGFLPDHGLRGSEVTKSLNSIVHGDPLSARFNLIGDAGRPSGFAVGKMIQSPDLCDEVCHHGICWMAVLLGLMSGIFPEIGRASPDGAERE